MKGISFIIIAYNEEKNIANCINSILNQKGLNTFEVIVVNDGSIDKTSKIVNNFKTNENIKLINIKKNKGRGFARYLGVSKSKGRYITFVDADIILPSNWLKKCLYYLKNYDAVGGIAIPDGDSTYISQKFGLKSKPIPHTTGITGSNVIYKHKIFEKINLNKNLRGGEDTDLNWKIMKTGFKIKLLNNLIVKHKEDITFKKSLKRFFAFGKGATNLFIKYKKIRLPDLAFFIFFLIISINIFLIFFGKIVFLTLLILFPLITSFIHIKHKFYITNLINYLKAIFINTVFIFSYYLGRIFGIWETE